MTNATYQKKLNTILGDDTLSGYGKTAEVINLTNILKSDIAEAIKGKAQSGGGVDFIDVPTAIDIVTHGGIPTRREIIELAQECMKDGDIEQANALLNTVLERE